mmetsp:Transcript_1218/g.3535  ORF Transcript_1218/g.3535 Transcript_1218/m.3535 type:complete len:336 (-) Transcript_1218:1055-2062(-)
MGAIPLRYAHSQPHFCCSAIRSEGMETITAGSGLSILANIEGLTIDATGGTASEGLRDCGSTTRPNTTPRRRRQDATATMSDTSSATAPRSVPMSANGGESESDSSSTSPRRCGMVFTRTSSTECALTAICTVKGSPVRGLTTSTSTVTVPAPGTTAPGGTLTPNAPSASITSPSRRQAGWGPIVLYDAPGGHGGGVCVSGRPYAESRIARMVALRSLTISSVNALPFTNPNIEHSSSTPSSASAMREPNSWKAGSWPSASPPASAACRAAEKMPASEPSAPRDAQLVKAPVRLASARPAPLAPLMSTDSTAGASAVPLAGTTAQGALVPISPQG